MSRATAASVLALALGLAACAGGTSTKPAAQSGDQKTAVLMKVADDTYAGGDPATAASLYRQIHDEAPKDPVPLTKLAGSFMAMKDYRAASEAYRAALALTPDDVDLHRGLALALLSLGDAEKAMTEIRTALAKRADDPRLYSVLGVAQDMIGRHDLAQQSYRNGLEMSPTNIGLRNNYGMSLALSGDYGAAVTKLGEIAGPNAPPRFRLNLALAYGLAGDDTKAAETARQVLDEKAVQSNLAYYSVLRGMDETRRTAAIIGAEIHGSSAAAAAAVVSQPRATADAPDAAPTQAVAALPLPAPPATLAMIPATETPPAKAHAAPSHRTAAATPTATPDPAPAPAPISATAPTSAPSAAAVPQPLMPSTPVSQLPPSDAKTAAQSDSAPSSSPQTFQAETPQQPAIATALPTVSPDAKPEMLARADAGTKSDATAPAPIPMASAAADSPAPAKDRMPPVAAAPTTEPPPPAREAAPDSTKAEPARASVATVETVLKPAPAMTDDVPKAATKDAPLVAMQMPPTAPAAPAQSGERYAIQLGSFTIESSAHRIADRFNGIGIAVTVLHSVDHDGREWFAVRTNEVASSDAASAMLKTIQSVGGVEPIMVHRHVRAA